MLTGMDPSSQEQAPKPARSGPPVVAEEPVAPTPLVPVPEALPSHLFLLPVTQTTLFPGMIIPVILPEGKMAKTVEHVLQINGYLGVILSRDTADATLGQAAATSMTGLPPSGSVAEGSVEPLKGEGGEIYRYGVVAKILKRINLPDNQISVLLTGLQRFEVKKLANKEPYLVAAVKYLHEEVHKGTELEALLRSCLSQFKQISKDNPLISEEVKVALVNIDGPGKLADFMASVLIRDVQDYQKFLSQSDVRERLHTLLLILKKEQAVQTVQKRIQEDINEKVTSAQKEFYLQEQLKSIQKELGRYSDERSKVAVKYRERLALRKPSKEVKARIDEEMEKLAGLHEQSSEYSVTLSYLDWATSLPWGISTNDSTDLRRARQILDEDHYGLKDVKERVLEFLAVKKLRKKSGGSILCLVGPPGTGKTSLGKSIARALDRKFFRFSVGGMRDEAEIKGHRRTYVGAMPGKLIQGLKRVGSQNPIFLIDEVDKIGQAWVSGGDPASALLELLDPEQNPEFLDHYLDIPFDCSDILFITTANSTDSIPQALLDRMEVIPLHGYTDGEKIKIARQYLIPKQLERNALASSQVKITEPALRYLIHHYAREAGVRNLEKQLSKIFRKVAYRVASGRKGIVRLTDGASVEKYLGVPPFVPEAIDTQERPGVAVGLAWTQFGGEVLQVESMAVEGRGGLNLTGTLGKVMQESANIAYTYVRNEAHSLRLPRHYFEKRLFHLHVPAGAIPKDGPSAGVTLAASLHSLVTGKPIRPGIAMTGELTLTGKVLPVGGIKEKLLAARRSGVKTVLLPKANARELKEIEPEVKAGLTIRLVATMDECLKRLF